MKTIRLVLALALAATLLVGCGERPASPTETIAPGAGGASALPGEGGLDLTNQLALGTLKLEETEHAVTPEQAAKLLPLWQIVQNGSLAAGAETKAILKQIEGRMDEAQLATIDGLGLAYEDTREWLEAQGIEMPKAPSGEAGPGAQQNLSEDARATMREEFQNLSPEQRAERMAELGIQPPEGGDPGAMRNGGGGQRNLLLDAPVALLT